MGILVRFLMGDVDEGSVADRSLSAKVVRIQSFNIR